MLIIGYMIYASERAYRYAKADPISALLGGSEFYNLLKDRMAARSPDIIIDQTPTQAPPLPAPQPPEQEGNANA